MLARLDRFADSEASESTHQAARLVAAEFDGFLDLIERDGGPARTGRFLAARSGDADADPDLDAVQALAHADRWLRTGHGTAAEVDTHDLDFDLDPDARAAWTAEQWARAEAAGMVAFTTPPESARYAPLSPLHPESEDEKLPVWWSTCADDWRTRFPPPPDFYGEETGTFGDPDYERALSDEERALVEAPHEAETAARRITEGRERDAWFAALDAAPGGGAADPADAPADDPGVAADDTGAFVPPGRAEDAAVPAACAAPIAADPPSARAESAPPASGPCADSAASGPARLQSSAISPI